MHFRRSKSVHLLTLNDVLEGRSNAHCGKRFVAQCGNTLPQIDEPFSMMDSGCGDGGLTVSLLRHLTDTGKVTEIAEVLLIDLSPAMVALAEKTVRDAFPDIHIKTVNSRIQDCSGSIDHRYDLAVSSLAYHHMPLEQKKVHLTRLKPWIDHFVLFEMDAYNDTPKMYSPDLALSVYQSYGGIIDFVFAHDAPVDVAVACVDLFLMTEVVSFFTQPRGVRTDYHMLQSQWHSLFTECLGPEFTPGCYSPCYADEHTIRCITGGKNRQCCTLRAEGNGCKNERRGRSMASPIVPAFGCTGICDRNPEEFEDQIGSSTRSTSLSARVRAAYRA